MPGLSERMPSDFTLFNLNDLETTKFYVSNIDFLVSNFPYFRDLKTVSSYFLSKNRKFNSKFKTQISKFLKIINYDPELCISPLRVARSASLLSLKHLSLSSEGGGQSPEGGGNTPERGGNTPEGTTDALPNYNPLRGDSSEGGNTPPAPTCNTPLAPAPNHDRPASLTSLPEATPPLFPNHSPSGPQFIINPPSLVFKFYSRILIAFIGSFHVSSDFLSTLVSKSSNEDIASLLCALVRAPSVMKTFISSPGISRLCDSKLPILAMVAEACFIDATDHSIRELLVSAIYDARDLIISRFLTDHSRSAYSVLHILCSSRGSLSVPEIVAPLDSFGLLYYRILSFNSAFTREILATLIDLFFGQPNCSHLLFSVSRILLKTDPKDLHDLGFFFRMKECSFRYSAKYSQGNTVDSLLAFLVKIYSRMRTFIIRLEGEWRGMIEQLDYFIRQEKLSYNDNEIFDEEPGFRRYIIECFLSEMPYSSVFEYEE